MADEDVVNNAMHAETDDQTELDSEHVDMYDGESMLSYPDATNSVVTMQRVQQMVEDAVNQERRRYADINKGVLRVNSNKSGAIQFRTYQITAAIGAVLIVKEKDSRGDTVITNFGGEPIFIGAHPGLVPNGSDTVQVAGGASRTIRTRAQLWAVTGSATAIQFDVQEEFD